MAIKIKKMGKINLLFLLQFVVGFFSFLLLLCCESATASFRAALVPIHSTFGITTFVMAVATACSGLTEKAFFTLRYVFLHTNVFQEREKKIMYKKKNACFSSNYLLEACWKKNLFPNLENMTNSSWRMCIFKGFCCTCTIRTFDKKRHFGCFLLDQIIFPSSLM